MKFVHLFGIACIVVPSVLLTAAQPPRSPQAASDLPVSLAKLYPPASPSPVYLQRMLGLSAGFSGLVADVLEQDVEHAKAGFAAFRGQYAEVAAMVPEWGPEFPIAPVEELGRALESGDTARCMKAVDAVGGVCHACHTSSMVPVQQAFRWKSFADIECTDRKSGEKLSYAKLMRDLDLGLSGIASDAAQGQAQQARGWFETFRTRFEQLEHSCIPCHVTQRRYYVDADVKARVADLGAALEASPLDPGRVGALVQQIGQASCGGCHMVHLPAAMAKAGGGH